ncbi:unnamed protein product [Mucor circinelloides]
MPPNSGTRQRNNLNDIKSLRAQYRQALPSLTELFPEWSHNDLLFVMDECQGDLDLAITRISEGHANQWGQVKSKKPKPKPTPAQSNHKKSNQKSSTTISPASPSSTNAYAEGKAPARGNNGKSKINGKHNKSKRNGSRKDKSEKKVVEKEEEEEKKPSWASIAKGPTKPEVVNQDTPSEAPPISTVVEESELEADSKMADEIVDQTQEKIEEQVLVETTDEAADQAIDQLITDDPEMSTVVIEEEPSVEPVVIVEPVVVTEPVVITEPVVASNTTVRKPTIRRLNQTEPVILPNNQQAAPLSSVNVQFGSLNLTTGEEITRDENEEAVEETAINVNAAKPLEETKVDVTPSPSQAPAITQVSEQTKPKETPAIATAPTATSAVASNGLASFHNTNKPLPEPFHPQQQQQQPPHIQPQSIQPQPIQQHVYNEPYTMNPYATYVPNMHNSVTGYIGGIPTDYYSADPQRMTYYDTSFYGQSPLMNSGANRHLFTRDGYNTPPPHPSHPPMEMMNHTPPPPSAPQYPHPHSHPAHHPHALPPPPPPVPQPQNYGYYSLSYQQQLQQTQPQPQPQPQPQQPYVNKSMYNAAIPINKYDYSAYEDYYQQQQQQNHEIMYSNNNNNNQVPSAPPTHPHFQQPYQQQQPQPSRQPYWH